MTEAARKCPGVAPVGVDPTRASIARVYDAFLNGKDNYEIDREVMRQVRQVAPEAPEMATDNRTFLIRACRFLSLQTGLTQFLDLGSGLPTAENTHQVVQRIRPDAKVVYVDNDPVVLAHGRALLEENETTHFVDEDIFQPHRVLENEEVRAHIDFSKPVGLLQVGTLHHHEGDRAEPAALMREYVERLAPGSFVVVSHFLDPENEHSAVAQKMEEVFRHSPMGSGTFRTRAEIQELFGELEMVPPGLVECVNWWPDGPQLKPLRPEQYCIAGGIGRKV